MDTYNEIWNAVLSYCEQRVTETAFNLWIKKTEFVSFEAATITLRLPSAKSIANCVPFFFNGTSTCQGMGVSMIPMLSGVVELIMRSIAAIYLSVPFGYEGICMAEPIAWISCAVFVFAAYHYFVRLLEKKYTPVN